jgi:hypothetical protein
MFEGEQGQGAGTAPVETTETTRVVETTENREGDAGITPAGAVADLGKVRELVLKANPDVVPDLIRGESVDSLIASVEPARSAYQRIAERVRGSIAGGESTVRAEGEATVNAEGKTTVVGQPPAVPAGGASNVVDPSTLAPTTKIAQGLARQKRG